MRQNVTFSIGNVAIIDKVDGQTGFFGSVLGNLAGRAKTFVPCIKLLMHNRLGDCVAVDRILDFTPDELLNLLGFKNETSKRTIYRTLERLGRKSDLVIERYQNWTQIQKLVDPTQLIDFSSSYFEGMKCPLGQLGYSRDKQPGKLQLTFGISLGLNEIPTALTIQKGNTQDKKHMKSTLRVCSKILKENSLLIFDCGGNTKGNKTKIRELGFHYLTLKAKKVNSYLKYTRDFWENQPKEIDLDKKEYYCVKKIESEEFQYIYFSEKLRQDQLQKKERKFQKALKRGETLLKKVKKNKELGQQVSSEGWIISVGSLQKILDNEIKNPYITKLEGFFILESSINEDPAKVLQLYKDRDKVEKFIRDLKEGAEIRPMRHWSEYTVIGYILIVFLTKVFINLTHILTENPLVKNLKVLKKYLNNLTVTVIYPKNSFRMSVISNSSDEIRAIFGDFIGRYGELTVVIPP